MKIHPFIFKKTLAISLTIVGILMVANVGRAASSSKKEQEVSHEQETVDKDRHEQEAVEKHKYKPETVAQDSHHQETTEKHPSQFLGQKGFLGKPHITDMELFGVLSLVGLSVLSPELFRRRKTNTKEVSESKKHIQVKKIQSDRESIQGSKLSQKVHDISAHSDVQRDLMDELQQIIQNEEVETSNTNETSKISPINFKAHNTASLPLPKKTDKSESKILIVDDSALVRKMLSLTFTTAGYQIEQACDGQEALEKLRAGLSCDLILSDIEMPRMDGLEFLTRLQEDEKLANIPVAMLTSYGEQKLQRMATQRGAKGYFLKPYIEAAMLDAAKRLMSGEILLEKDYQAVRQHAA